MNIQFDLERSKRGFKPNYGVGVQYIDRRLVKLSEIIHIDKDKNTYQPRVFDAVRTNVNKLKDSISNRYDYKKPVMVCELGLDDKLYLKAGFNRRQCYEELNQPVVIVDVVQYDSPAESIAHGILSNEYHDIAEDNDDRDYAQALKQLIIKNCCERDDDAYLKDFLKKISPSKSPAQRTAIFKKFRKSFSSYDFVKDVDQTIANGILEDNDFPSQGYVLDLGQIGFARSDGDFGTKIKQMVDLYDKYQQPIQIFGFILNIDPAKITNQRKAWLKKYESTIHWIRQHLAEEYHDIFQFIGFLGQIKTKDTLNHGLSKEDILVDVNGKSIG
jgi:hypothetical protein